jgi:hypothetical protein
MEQQPFNVEVGDGHAIAMQSWYVGLYLFLERYKTN